MTKVPSYYTWLGILIVLAVFGGTYFLGRMIVGRSSPTISLSTDSVDLGTVPVSYTARGKIMIQNSGQAPLIIAMVKTSCTCTTSKLANKSILGGASVPLEFSIACPNWEGEFDHDIAIHSNAVNAPLTVVRIHAKTVTLLVTNPSTVYLDWNDRNDAPPGQVIGVREGRLADINTMETLRVATDNPLIHCQIEAAEQEDVMIRVSIEPSSPNGLVTGDVLLHVDTPMAYTKKIPFYAQVWGKANARPQSFDTGTVSIGKKPKASSRVVSDEVIQRVETVESPPGTKVEASRLSATEFNVEFEGPVAQSSGVLRGEVLLSCMLGDPAREERLLIPYTGICKADSSEKSMALEPSIVRSAAEVLSTPGISEKEAEEILQSADSTFIDDLIAAAQDSKRDWMAQNKALFILGKSGDTRVISIAHRYIGQHLGASLTSTDYYCVIAGFRALAFCGGPESLDYLKQYANKEYWSQLPQWTKIEGLKVENPVLELRAQAIDAIGMSDIEPAIALLETLAPSLSTDLEEKVQIALTYLRSRQKQN